MDQNQDNNPGSQPNEQNQYMPPAPSGYTTSPEPGYTTMDQPSLQQPPLPVDIQIQRRKNQARWLIVAAAIFMALFVLGIILLAATSLNNSSDVPENSLTTDEKLKQDLNTLGLGIINYSSGSTTFTLTPQNATELKISYLPLEFNDPRTEKPYAITTEIPKEGELQYISSGQCNEDDSISQSKNKKDFAIRVLLESETLYCLDRGEIKQVTEPQP